MSVFRAIVMSVCGCLPPFLAAGQSPLDLTYDPAPDIAVRISFFTAVSLNSSAGRLLETADLGVVSATPLALADGGTVIHLAYDSLKARVRATDGRWRESAVRGGDSTNWKQVRIDDRMRLLGSGTGTELPAVTSLVDILTGLPGLTLPEQPLPVRGGWVSEARLPHRGGTAFPPNVGALSSLTFWTRLTLDSVVIRELDTLGFITARGHAQIDSDLDPQTTDLLVVLDGQLEGNLVWSTGWGTFVSGMQRTSVRYLTARTSDSAAGGREELTLRLTTRFQVRP